MKEQLIPFTDISEHFPIRIKPPPPYRDQLLVRADLLGSALRWANIRNNGIRIRFQHIRTAVDLYPYGNWQWIPHTEDLDNTQMRVTINDIGVFQWTFPYRDSEIDSAPATARLTSKFMKDAIGESTMLLYVEPSVGAIITEKVLPATFYAMRKMFDHNIGTIVVAKNP